MKKRIKHLRETRRRAYENMTEKGKQTKGMSYITEDLVKRKLWSYGYNVKHFGKRNSFDLLVNDKIKVEVKTSKMRINKNPSWAIMLNKCNEYDVMAVVLQLPINKYKIIYFDRKTIEDKVIAKTVITINNKDDNILRYSKESPYDVLGKPNKGRIIKN